MSEKMQLVSSKDYGRDEAAADKLLTKHKALKGDMQTYEGIVDNLAAQAHKLVKKDPGQGKEIKDKQVSQTNVIINHKTLSFHAEFYFIIIFFCKSV